MTDRFDHLILGAGARGLGAALRLRRQQPDMTLQVLDADTRPGGSIRTQRSNGFSCELGPFAFDRAELEPLLALLPQPPALVEAGCATGWLFDGAGRQEVAVSPLPASFASGCEELAQACRRELGGALGLGRAVRELRPAEGGFEIELAGEVPTVMAAENLVLGLPLTTAAQLLAGFDPVLPEVAERLVREPRAFVFLGGLRRDCQALTGYGVVPADSVPSPVVETIFCSNVFAGRCLPDRFLLRSELVGEAATGDDDAVIQATIDELRRWTGCEAEFGFTKVHRFETTARDATWAECQARLRGIAARVDTLQIA